MRVRVETPDVASAESLRRGFASLFGAGCVSLNGSGTAVSLATVSHGMETVTSTLNEIEHWLGLNDIASAQVELDDHTYLIARHAGLPAPPVVQREAADVRRRFRVLVVDDDPAIRMIWAANLAQAGVEVLQAEDGGRGLERVLEDRPDLVLLDVNMPVLDGFALAERLRDDDRTKDVPFIFITGELEPEIRTRAEALGAAGFVSKPFDPAPVTALVVSLLMRMRSSAEPLSA